jgi:hypothetical protein
LIPVDGVDNHVAVTVKHDGRNSAAGLVVLTRFPYAGRPPPAASPRRRDVTGRPARQSGVHADGP